VTVNLDDTQIPESKQQEFYAAAEAIRAFQRKAVLGRCMFWASECENAPIASHLIPESWLRKIADTTNHVVHFELLANNVAKNGAAIEARRVGVSHKPSVTFPGFCNKHDSKLFRCLEQDDFTATPEQLLALTYRSVCREVCAKQQMVACHLPRALDANAHPLLTMQTVNEMKNCLRLLAWKQQLEDTLAGGRNELAGYIVEFAVRPNVLASVTFSFPMTFTGRKLDARYEWITLSLVPRKTGGFAVFTWNKRTPKNPSLLVKSFKAIPSELQATALLNLLVEVSENIYLDPGWWHGLAQPVQNQLLARFSRSITTGNPAPRAGSLLPAKPLINWGIVNASHL
jgi:hypothetical protein